MTFVAWLDKNFLMVGLITALTLGLVFPGPGKALVEQKVHVLMFSLSQWAVVIIFMISGLTLQAVTQWRETIKALITGSIFVLFISPLLGFPILAIDQVVAVEPMLLKGMALFCAVPTTLSSGVAMVKSAGGNVPLALILTTATNLLGVFTMPYSMSLIFQSSGNIKIDGIKMLTQLVIQTLIPLVLGILLQKVPAIKDCVTSIKAYLGKASNVCIFFVVWLNASGSQGEIAKFPAKDILVTCLLAILVHIVYRLAAYFLAESQKFPGPEWVALVLMCSQKSLPVCVSVLEALPQGISKDKGILIVPCILSHFSQLMIDGFLADRWKLDSSGNFAYFNKQALLAS